MFILGIDPGTGKTGYGIIESLRSKKKNNGLRHITDGVIRTAMDLPMEKRLLELRKEIKKLILFYKPDCCAVEQIFFGQNSRTAMTVGQARGVVMVTAAECRLPFFEYQGLSVKKFLTGNGRAKKNQVREAVQKTLRMKEKPRTDDAADALAIAVFHAAKIFK